VFFLLSTQRFVFRRGKMENHISTPPPFHAVRAAEGADRAKEIPPDVTQLGRSFRSGLRDRGYIQPSHKERAGTCLLFLQRLRAKECYDWIDCVEREVSNFADFLKPMERWTGEELKVFLKQLFEQAWCEDAVSPSVRGLVDAIPTPGYGQSAPTAALVYELIEANILQLQDRTLPAQAGEHKGYYYVNFFCGRELDLIESRVPEMGTPCPVERDWLFNQPYAEYANVKQRYEALRLSLIKVIAAMALACGCPPSSSDGPPVFSVVS
jgi:hypothetical protein